MTQAKVALVTGANRGIGFEISRQLARAGHHVILTARNKLKGQDAVARLAGEGLVVSFHELEVTDSGGIQLLDAYIRREHKRLDILINNAAVFLDRPQGTNETSSIMNTSTDVFRTTIATNVYGPILLIQKFLPLMQENKYGRIVNLSSGLGQLSEMADGWPAYRMSKTAINVVTRTTADAVKDQNILVNSVCPGWVRTEMGGEGATRSPEEGADTVVWAATLPDGSASGKFFRDRKEISW